MPFQIIIVILMIVIIITNLGDVNQSYKEEEM